MSVAAPPHDRTGRSTQEDPIGLAGGLNLYGFGQGDAVNNADPFGLFPHAVAAVAATWAIQNADRIRQATVTIFATALAVAEAVKRRERCDETERLHVTYSLSHPSGTMYAGRTSGCGSAEWLVQRRFNSHHMRIFGFGSPTVDCAVRGPDGRVATRGREQQLIDAYGGARLDNRGTAGNLIRAVRRGHAFEGTFEAAANALCPGQR